MSERRVLYRFSTPLFRDPAGNMLSIYQQPGLAEIEAEPEPRQPMKRYLQDKQIRGMNVLLFQNSTG
jgi:hypothetical protein